MDYKISFTRYSKKDFDELAKKYNLTRQELELAIDEKIEEQCEYIACNPIDKNDIKLSIIGSIVPKEFFVHGIRELHPIKSGEKTVWKTKLEGPSIRELRIEGESKG